MTEIAVETPAGDLQGTSGQGGEGNGSGEATTTYGGFESPEALAEAYTDLSGERTALQQQITNLEGIKGRHGTEIGQLRTHVAQLTGQIEGLNTVRQQEQPQGPTLDDISEQLEDGKITQAQALRMAQDITTQAVTTKLGAEFKQLLQQEIGAFKQTTEREKYVSKFLQDNPGYSEAYEGGKLQPWLNQGMVGEDAWLHYQLQEKNTELQAIKDKAALKTKEAEEKGINTGVKLEQGKNAAGKVLTGKGGQFSQSGKATLDPTAPNFAAQRRQAGIDTLNQMRSGG